MNLPALATSLTVYVVELVAAVAVVEFMVNLKPDVATAKWFRR